MQCRNLRHWQTQTMDFLWVVNYLMVSLRALRPWNRRQMYLTALPSMHSTLRGLQMPIRHAAQRPCTIRMCSTRVRLLQRPVCRTRLWIHQDPSCSLFFSSRSCQYHRIPRPRSVWPTFFGHRKWFPLARHCSCRRRRTYRQCRRLLICRRQLLWSCWLKLEFSSQWRDRFSCTVNWHSISPHRNHSRL